MYHGVGDLFGEFAGVDGDDVVAAFDVERDAQDEVDGAGFVVFLVWVGVIGVVFGILFFVIFVLGILGCAALLLTLTCLGRWWVGRSAGESSLKVVASEWIGWCVEGRIEAGWVESRVECVESRIEWLSGGIEALWCEWVGSRSSWLKAKSEATE